MVMGNGTGRHAAPANGKEALADVNDTTVVHVNFGLKPRHIYAFIVGIPAGLAALGAAGYAVLPASKAEVTAIQQGVADLKTHMTAEIGGLKGVNAEIIGAVRELRAAVAELRAPRVAPRPRSEPRPRPAPPKASGGGLFDF
jgi:hypothetical protein